MWFNDEEKAVVAVVDRTVNIGIKIMNSIFFYKN